MALRLPLDAVAAVDAWLTMHPEPRPSRSEAIRSLLAEALGRPADARADMRGPSGRVGDPDRARDFLTRAAEALRGAQFDDLAGLKISEEMEAAKAAVIEAWEELAHKQWVERFKAEEAARKADAVATETAAIAMARSPAAIRATGKAIERAKVEDHAVAYLRDELGEERFVKFVNMFHQIRPSNGLNSALWRIGHFVPNIECGTLINPETGDIARRELGGKAAWIETKDGVFKAGNNEAAPSFPVATRRLRRR